MERKFKNITITSKSNYTINSDWFFWITICIKENLNKYGIGIIDFLNAQFIIDNLVPDEIKTVNDITFT